jgi:hypothetical protein
MAAIITSIVRYGGYTSSHWAGHGERHVGVDHEAEHALKQETSSSSRSFYEKFLFQSTCRSLRLQAGGVPNNQKRRRRPAHTDLH